MKKQKYITALLMGCFLVTSCGESTKEKQTYTITFYDENNTAINEQKLEEGQNPSFNYDVKDTDERDYTFKGWSETPTGEILETIPKVTGDAKCYAIVTKEKRKYTITFETNCDFVMPSVTVEYGSTIDEPEKIENQGFRFVGWTKDAQGDESVTFPYTVTKNETFYAKWNEKVDIKSYLKTLMTVIKNDPSSYIPSTLRAENTANHVSKSQIDYNFETNTSVSKIQYGGFGEQWNMVINNIKQSELFYSVLSVGEVAINTSVIAFNNFLDKNTSDTASHTVNDSQYTAHLDYQDKLLTYSLKYKTNLEIPFFGQVEPQIDMVYDIESSEKTVRIQITDKNALKYSLKDNRYMFALEYGVEALSRKAYFELDKLEDGTSKGAIYEFIQYKDKDLVPSCAEFYIGKDYTSVVGNKASGLVGFQGYINELYNTNEGKLLGYKVRETLEILGVKGQYNTLWFNLNNITGIESVKAIPNDNFGLSTNKNPYDIYLNGSTQIFEPAYNKKLAVKTSRKYDVELRKQYFYTIENEKIVENETNIPMMFIQDDNSIDTNYSDFSSDMLKISNIKATVNLPNKYLNKIREDYNTLIDVFIEHK